MPGGAAPQSAPEPAPLVRTVRVLGRRPVLNGIIRDLCQLVQHAVGKNGISSPHHSTE